MIMENEFKKICEKKAMEFLPKIKGRNVYIWGACKGGKRALQSLGLLIVKPERYLSLLDIR